MVAGTPIGSGVLPVILGPCPGCRTVSLFVVRTAQPAFAIRARPVRCRWVNESAGVLTRRGVGSSLGRLDTTAAWEHRRRQLPGRVGFAAQLPITRCVGVVLRRSWRVWASAGERQGDR